MSTPPSGPTDAESGDARDAKVAELTEDSLHANPMTSTLYYNPNSEDPCSPGEDHPGGGAASSSPSTSSSSSWKLAHRWNEAIRVSHNRILLLVILLLWPAGLWSLKNFLGKTDSTFHQPVHGSPSASAQQAIDRTLPLPR